MLTARVKRRYGSSSTMGDMMMAKDSPVDREAEVTPPLNVTLPPIDATPGEIAQALVRTLPRKPEAEEIDDP